MPNKINFYVPIEIKSRELYSKILLAKYAAKNGFNVILGRKHEINRLVERSEPGVYYGLGTVKNFSAFYQKLSGLGHFIAVNDEEGLVTYSDKMYIDLKVSAETVSHIDLLFAWGEANLHVIKTRVPSKKCKIISGGNPRFDLLKSQYSNIYSMEVAEIKKRYNNFILVCSSFAACNHYSAGSDYIKELIEKKVLTNEENIKEYARYYNLKEITLECFLQAIPLLAKQYPNTDIVIRPHPSEDSKVYLELTKQFANIHLEHRFSVHPWLMAASALVHHYCTTSVEAFAIGTAGFALRPETDPSMEKDIPYMCSQICHTPEELIELIEPVLQETSGRLKNQQELKDIYASYVLNIGNVVASELIVKEIKRSLGERPKVNSTGIGVPYRPSETRHRIGLILSRFNPRRRASHRYIKHKFDRLSLAEVRDVLDVFSNGEPDFRCVELQRNVMSITGG